MTKKLIPQGRKLTVLAACAFMAACGGGGGGGGAASEGRLQVIDFSYPGGNTLLNGPTTLSATATSGMPVTFRSGTPATCTVADNKLTLVAAGECLVIASQAGGEAGGIKWAAADETSQLFNVLKHAQLPVLPVGVVLRASTANVTLPDKTDAGIPATYASVTPSLCTVSGTTLTALGVGACQLVVSAPADANYEAMADTLALIQVGPVPPMVVKADGKTRTVALTSVDAGGNALSYASTTPTVCTVVGSELRLNAKGSCAVTMSSAGGASENFQVHIDPRVFASGFNPGTNRTNEFGELNYSAGFPLAWCGGGPNPPNCNRSVLFDTVTFSLDANKALNPTWNGSSEGWWSFLLGEVGAPRKKVDANTEWLPFDVKTEESLFVMVGINPTAFDLGESDNERGLYVRIKTNHFQKKANGDDCYVTVSAHLRPAAAGPTGYVVPFKDFAVTDKCEIGDLPQTEGWMFDWGVSAESKAAALAEIRAHGIRAVQFSPSKMNHTRPTPNADGSLPSPTDAAYTLSTAITVYGPITVQ